MTTYTFLAGLPTLDEAQWRRVEAAAANTTAHLDDWDAAWNLIVALGLAHQADPAMAAAREAGAGLRVQALAGAACAAVAARGQIGERRFRALYRPFAAVLPADPTEGGLPPVGRARLGLRAAYPPEERPLTRGRLAALCPMGLEWH